MIFSPASIFGFFSPASPELNVIVDVLAQVQSKLDNLDAVIGENGPAVAPIVDASLLIVSTITAGIETVSGLENLRLGSSVRLIGPVSELRKHTQALSDRLLEVKPQIDGQDNAELVRREITRVKEATQLLVSAVSDKIPSEIRGVATQQAQGIVDVLTRLETSFSLVQ